MILLLWNFLKCGRRVPYTASVRACIVAVVLAVIGLSSGCANGTYPFDIFYEMHYQQSYESHEPPRLTIPSSAVSVMGIELQGNENPIPGQRIEDGAQLFVSNCAFCHGSEGKGDGPVLQIMKSEYGYGTDEKPYTITPDLTSQFVRNQDDLGIFGWITNGVRVMPSFNKLLSVEERWLLVNYIRSLEG